MSAGLPAWVGFAGLVYWPVATFLIGWTASWAVSTLGLWPLRRGTDIHWTERARIGYPVRLILAVGLLIALLMPMTLAGNVKSPLSLLPGWVTLAVAALAGWAGMSFGVRRSWLGLPRFPVRERVRSAVVFACLYLPSLLVFAILVGVMPLRMNGRAWITLGIGALAMALTLWRSGLPVLRLLGLARPASERLRQAVGRAEERVAVRPAAVWEVPWGVANAMALVFSRELVFTSCALRLLDDDQLTAVAAHELGHLSEPPRVKAARALGPFLLLALSAAVPAYRTYGWIGLGGLYAAVIVASLFLRRVGRRMEVRADAIGQGSEEGAGIYARALERMYESNLVPAVLSGRFRVHPSLWDRMVGAGMTPDYPRPRPPSRMRSLILYIVLAIVFAAGWVVADAVIPGLLAPQLLGQEKTEILRIGLHGDLQALRRLAILRGEQGRMDEATALWRTDMDLEPRDVQIPSYLAGLEAQRGRCDEAGRMLDIARQRLGRGSRDADGASSLDDAEEEVSALCPTAIPASLPPGAIAPR